MKYFYAVTKMQAVFLPTLFPKATVFQVFQFS